MPVPRLAGIILEAFGEAEIGDFRHAIELVAPRRCAVGRAALPREHGRAEEHVGGFQVPMGNAAPVSKVHGLRQDLNELSCRQNRLRQAAGALLQTAAIDVLQRQVGAAVDLAYFIDLDDMWMLQMGHRLRFITETRQLCFARMPSCQDHFESYHTLQAALACLVDNAHRTAAQNLQDVVAGHGGEVALERLQSNAGQHEIGIFSLARRMDAVCTRERGAGPVDRLAAVVGDGLGFPALQHLCVLWELGMAEAVSDVFQDARQLGALGFDKVDQVGVDVRLRTAAAPPASHG